MVVVLSWSIERVFREDFLGGQSPQWIRKYDRVRYWGEFASFYRPPKIQIADFPNLHHKNFASVLVIVIPYCEVQIFLDTIDIVVN